MTEKQSRHIAAACLIFILAPAIIVGLSNIDLQKKMDSDVSPFSNKGNLTVAAHYWPRDNSFVLLLVANNRTSQVFITEIRVNGTVFPANYTLQPYSDLLIQIKGDKAFVSQAIYEFCLVTADYDMCRYVAMAL